MIPGVGITRRGLVRARSVMVTAALLTAVDKAERKWLGYVGATVRNIARTSIKRFGKSRRCPTQKYLKQPSGTGKPRFTKAFRHYLWEVKTRPASAPGTPPHTHTGLLRKSILYNVNMSSRNVIIGPTYEIMKFIGRLHEYGGTHLVTGRPYPARPYMRPARIKAQPKINLFWQNLVS